VVAFESPRWSQLRFERALVRFDPIVRQISTAAADQVPAPRADLEERVLELVRDLGRPMNSIPEWKDE
jgi:hypothetical protein